MLGLHISNPDCPVGRRVQEALVDLDRRAAAALATELDRTTVADMMGWAHLPSRAAASV